MSMFRRLARLLTLIASPVALAAWSGVGHAEAPPGRYVISKGGTSVGTVYDTYTRLTWQQQVSATTYAWSSAGTYCTANTPTLPGPGWRLPTLKELQTLADYTIASPGPTIDPTAFPNTPSTAFWTSSPLAGTTGSAWYVNFSSGSTGYLATSYPNQVRCVR